MRENFASAEKLSFIEKMRRAETFGNYDNPCLDLYSVQICQPPILPLSNLANFSPPPPPILQQTPKSPIDDQTIYVAKILAYLPQLHHQQRQKSPHHLRSPIFQSGPPKIITAEEARLAQEITAQLANAGVPSPASRISVNPEFFRNNQVPLPLHQSVTGTTEPSSLLPDYDKFEVGKFREMDALEIKTEPIWDFHKTQLSETIRNFVPLLQAKSPNLRRFDDYDSSNHSEIYKVPNLQDVNVAIKITPPEQLPQNLVINRGDYRNNTYSSPSPQSYLLQSPENTSVSSLTTTGSDSGIESLASHKTFPFSPPPHIESEATKGPLDLALTETGGEKKRKTVSTLAGTILLPPKKRKYTDDAVETQPKNDFEDRLVHEISAQSQFEGEQPNRMIRSPEIPALLALERVPDECPKPKLPPRPALIVANPMARSARPSEAIKCSLFSPHHQLTSDETERSKVNVNNIVTGTTGESPHSDNVSESSPKSSFSSPREKVIIKNNNRSLHMFGYLSPESPISSSATFSPLSSASVSPVPPLKAAKNSSFNQAAVTKTNDNMNNNDSNTIPKAPSSGGASGRKAVDSLTCFIRHRSQNIPKEKTFVCEHANCNKAYAKAAHLKSHLRVHTGERPFPCEWAGCSKQFVRSDELKRHMRVHTGENRFICPLCSMKFKRSDHLTKHAKKHPNFHMNMLRRPEDIEKRQKEMLQTMLISANNAGAVTPNAPQEYAGNFADEGEMRIASSASPFADDKATGSLLTTHHIDREPLQEQ